MGEIGVGRISFHLRILRFTSWYLDGNFLCTIRSPTSVSSYGHQKSLPFGKLFLFFCNADCTNNNYHFQTLLTLTTILIIHLCVHCWGASTAQPGVKRPGNLQFSYIVAVSVRKRHGNLNNITICNGKVQQVLANVNGVLAVACRSNNGGHVTPPAGSLRFNINVEIPNYTSKGDSAIPNGGIERLVEITQGPDPNITVTEGADTTFIGVVGVNTNRKMNFYF